MTKSDLIDEVAVQARISRDRASLVVNTVFEKMIESMKRGDRIEIRNFGNFTIREYGEYIGRNPKSGETVKVPVKKMPFFKVGLELKKIINKPK